MRGLRSRRTASERRTRAARGLKTQRSLALLALVLAAPFSGCATVSPTMPMKVEGHPAEPRPVPKPVPTPIPRSVPAPWSDPQPREGKLLIWCTYRFYNAVDEKELSLIAQTVRQHASDGRVQESSGSDSQGRFHEYRFAVASVAEIEKLDSVLPFRGGHAGQDGSAVLLYEQFDTQYFTRYRTVTITGSVEIVVRFRITPGASLYYSIGPGKEIPVPQSSVDASGRVALRVRIPRSQQFVYGRSVLGGVQRYLRINVETGQAEEIGRAAYLGRR